MSGDEILTAAVDAARADERRKLADRLLIEADMARTEAEQADLLNEPAAYSAFKQCESVLRMIADRMYPVVVRHDG